MKTYAIEYTTENDLNARYSDTITAADLSKAYLAFIFANPINIIIIDITEV